MDDRMYIVPPKFLTQAQGLKYGQSRIDGSGLITFDPNGV